MVVNQYLENARGVNRHGSCGVGFGETIERHEHGFPLYVKDLVESGLRERLERMAFDWYPRRLQALGISASKPHHFEEYYTLYSQQIKKFVQRVRIADYSAINATNSFIFEGAQGLLLDQDHHYFPHVTRSKTGLGAAVRVAEQLGVHWLEPVYVTRSYVTRHGAGPLPEECERLGKDETNVAHPFQGELRYAKLDLEMLRHRVGVDWSSFYSPDVLIDGPSLAVNCLDQTDGAFITPRGNVKWTELKGWVKYASFGSDRLDIEEIR